MTTYYDAISKKANKFANMLKNFGIHKGRFIYAIVDDAELLWIAELGTLRFNCLFGAMPISTPEKRIKEILLESKAQLILIDAAFKPMVDKMRSELPELWHVVVVNFEQCKKASSAVKLGAGDFIFEDYFVPAPDTAP